VRHLDLFSGIGGFALAARWVGWETVGFCEIDPYCQKVLRKHWPDAPIHGDIKTYEGQECDIITGGFPCQPYSQIGKQRGTADDRALWPEYRRIISSRKPRWVVGENVVGIINMELDNITSDLEDLGYDVNVFVIPACAVGANHRRDRVWIVADSDSTRSQGQQSAGLSEWGEAVGHDRPRHRWMPTPRVCRGSDGISNRVDRLKGLGNAIVPQISEVIFRAINEQN
jgi:DNA (cytosine-5)-methyltransferase 1